MPMHLLKVPLHVLNHYFLATGGEDIRGVFAVEKTRTRGRTRGYTERERSSRCGDRTNLPGWSPGTCWGQGKKKNGGIQSATAIGENRSENKDNAHHPGSMHAKGLCPHLAR
jgi:hypothetical protein